MKTVTVDEFSTNVAAHLAEVERGEQVLITRDDQIVAELTPSRIPSWKRPWPPLGQPGVSLTSAIIEDRDERAAVVEGGRPSPVVAERNRPKPWQLPCPKASLTGPSTARAIIEERETGW